ncbi:cysteine hydrolase family protein [Pseudonocardia sp.]|uniref:cysteine hydrolase family protein n=1 Tax=Pseudonocardia sp. TaxID=60912 RepID=UPI003D11687E
MTGMQNDYCSPSGALSSTGAAVDSIAAMAPAAEELLELCRSSAVPVFHSRLESLAAGVSDSPAWTAGCRRNGLSDGFARSGSWGSQPVQGFADRMGEFVVPRFRSGAMSDSSMTVLLRSEGVDTLLLAGVETQQSVLATVVQAANLDFRVIVMATCVASTRADLHDSALDLCEGFATIERRRPSPAVLESLNTPIGVG